MRSLIYYMILGKIFNLVILWVISSRLVFGQSKQETEILANTRLLHETVFGTKDSSTLEELFARDLTYGHSGGKTQSRPEAINGIIHNKSTYTDTSLKTYNIMLNGDVAIVRYTMKETETNNEGKAAPLRLSIMLVWINEKGKWKLFGRQAVKLPE